MIRDNKIYKAYCLGYDQSEDRIEKPSTYSDRVLQYSYEIGVIDWSLNIEKENQEKFIDYILKKIKNN